MFASSTVATADLQSLALHTNSIKDINTVYRDMRGQWRRTWTARASFISQSTARTKTSTAYCADLKLIVGHLQMPCDIRVTYGLWSSIVVLRWD